MQTNETPQYDVSDNPTNCCPRFNPENWDDQELHFKDKLFVKAETKSLLHIPVNMDKVFTNTFKAIQSADAENAEQSLVLSRDASAWKGEHYFAVTKEVPGVEMVKLSGDYVIKVFEGPYKEAKNFDQELTTFVENKGKKAKRNYFFYTTCPKCAKFYGENYMVGVAEIE